MKKWHLDQVLATISDIQTFNGISLLIGALVQHASLDLYHYHIIYDTVNFTGVSFCAALVNVFNNKKMTIIDRYVLLTIFMLLYLAFVILFGLKLDTWDDDVPGHCYDTTGIAAPSSAHPLVDTIYLTVTCLYFFTTLTTCVKVAQYTLTHEFLDDHARTLHRFGVKDKQIVLLKSLVDGPLSYIRKKIQSNTRLKRFSIAAKIAELTGTVGDPKAVVLGLALGQYPLHAYMVFTLRSSNESSLAGESENRWGFGQVIALVLVASSLLECTRAVFEYLKDAKEIRSKAHDRPRAEELELGQRHDRDDSKPFGNGSSVMTTHPIPSSQRPRRQSA
ncbi:hypothetical protein MMC25_005954 [Agyrium rufum]|nr:hypothetical protein [Agyrium rufum]